MIVVFRNWIVRCQNSWTEIGEKDSYDVTKTPPNHIHNTDVFKDSKNDVESVELDDETDKESVTKDNIVSSSLNIAQGPSNESFEIDKERHLHAGENITHRVLSISTNQKRERPKRLFYKLTSPKNNKSETHYRSASKASSNYLIIYS